MGGCAQNLHGCWAMPSLSLGFGPLLQSPPSIWCVPELSVPSATFSLASPGMHPAVEPGALL